MGNVRKYKHLSCFDLLELILTDAQFEEAAGVKLKKMLVVTSTKSGHPANLKNGISLPQIFNCSDGLADYQFRFSKIAALIKVSTPLI